MNTDHKCNDTITSISNKFLTINVIKFYKCKRNSHTKKRNFIINIWLTRSTVHSSIFVVGMDLGFWAANLDDTLCVRKELFKEGSIINGIWDYWGLVSAWVLVSNSNKLVYLHDSIFVLYCKSMPITIKI